MGAVLAASGLDAGAYDTYLTVAVAGSADGLAVLVRAGDAIAPPAGAAPEPVSAEQMASNLRQQDEATAELAKLADAYAAQNAGGD